MFYFVFHTNMGNVPCKISVGLSGMCGLLQCSNYFLCTCVKQMQFVFVQSRFGYSDVKIV